MSGKVAQKDGERKWVRDRKTGERNPERWTERKWKNRDTQTHREKLRKRQRNEGWRGRDKDRDREKVGKRQRDRQG